MKIEALLTQIRKLKAKADDPSTTEAESMAFAAKVAELLARHGLEEAQLKVEDQEETVGQEEIMGKSWETSPARKALVAAVCRLYMVRVIRYRKRGLAWTLVGRKTNIILVREMSEYLIKTVLRLSNQYGKENPGTNVVDFRRGCFARLSERLIDLYWQQRRAAAQYTPQGNPGNLPALYKSEEQLADEYLKRQYPNLRSFKSPRIKQGVDAMAGRRAGDSISLDRQIGNGKQTMIGRT